MTFLVFCQALGAIVGVTTTVWSELAYLKAMRDGKINNAERMHLLIIGHGLRYGLTLLLLASIGLVITAFINKSALQPALTPSYWILMVVALVIISVSWGFARRHLSFRIASATLFTAWWFIVYLSFGLLPLSFGSAAASFVVAAVIFYALLHYARLLALPR